MLETRVLFLGSDAVGKTTILYKLKFNEIVTTIPTIGFNVETIEYKNRKINIFDIGGNEKIRALWNHYYKGSKCIVYIMNISDKERLNDYIECFNTLLDQHKEYRNIPIIIFGNIFNEKTIFDPEEILQKSNLPPEIAPHIIKGNAIKGEGFNELLDYIYNNIEFNEKVIEEKEEIGEKEITEEKVEKESYKVIMLGLNGSGKTTILYSIKLGIENNTLPTLGFNVETINKNNWEKSITLWDIGGGKKIRVLWRHYVDNINGIIWVYDISDNETIEESQNELKKLLDYPNINKNKPLLIFANKTDLNINENKKEEFLNGISDYLNMPYFIKECNFNDVESYKEGLDWLYNNLE